MKSFFIGLSLAGAAIAQEVVNVNMIPASEVTPVNNGQAAYPQVTQPPAPVSEAPMPYETFTQEGWKTMACGYGWYKQSDGHCVKEQWYQTEGCYQTTIINNHQYCPPSYPQTHTVTETVMHTVTETATATITNHVVETQQVTQQVTQVYTTTEVVPTTRVWVSTEVISETQTVEHTLTATETATVVNTYTATETVATTATETAVVTETMVSTMVVPTTEVKIWTETQTIDNTKTVEVVQTTTAVNHVTSVVTEEVTKTQVQEKPTTVVETETATATQTVVETKLADCIGRCKSSWGLYPNNSNPHATYATPSWTEAPAHQPTAYPAQPVHSGSSGSYEPAQNQGSYGQY